MPSKRKPIDPALRKVAGPVDPEKLVKAVERYEAGETRDVICTGRDGWPSKPQLQRLLKENPELAARFKEANRIRARERIRAASEVWKNAPKAARSWRHKRVKRTPEEAAAHRAEKQAAAEARRQGAIARLAAVEADRQARAAERAEKARRRAIMVAINERKKAEAKAAAKLVRDQARQEKRRRLQAERAAMPRAPRKAPRKPSGPRMMRPADPPEVRFANRLGRPDAKGCQLFHGKTFGMDKKRSMSPQVAALHFTGKIVPKGQEPFATCGTAGCCNAAHLDIRPKERKVTAAKPIDPTLIAVACKVIADRHGIPAPDILLRNETRDRGPVHLVRARQELRYILSVEFSHPMNVVGAAVGADRTTVAYGNGVIEDLRDDPEFDSALDATFRKIAEGYRPVAPVAH